MAKKILIVEDEKNLSNALMLSLTKKGYEAQIAADGIDGLEKLKTFSPDLIILDIIMPRLDGLGFFQKLREKPEFKHLPVIVLTNWSDEEKKKTAEKLGVVHYMIKANWDMDDILDKVGEVLK